MLVKQDQFMSAAGGLGVNWRRSWETLYSNNVNEVKLE